MKDEKLKDKFTEEDGTKLEPMVATTTQWLENNLNAEANEYEAKQKELEDAFNKLQVGKEFQDIIVKQNPLIDEVD